ncbi:helix-turn-helix domain-containing protein [Achromobacter sp.]|uniref:helix-turn-helix domain-containing protein n=1 Tax=Achromobacter sp. TaxID=134375 RepID=UPI003C70B21A
MARQIKLYTNAIHGCPPDEPAQPGDAPEDAERRGAPRDHGEPEPDQDAEAGPAFVPLSSRQQQILQYIIEGRQNKTIADLLGIELVTVKMHVGLLFKKLGVTNRTMAAVRGVELLSVVEGVGSRYYSRGHRGAKVRAGSDDYALPARAQQTALLDQS